MERKFYKIWSRYWVLVLIIVVYVFVEQSTAYHYNQKIHFRLSSGYYLIDITYFIFAAKVLVPYGFSRGNKFIWLSLMCALGLVLFIVAQNIMELFVDILYDANYNFYSIKISFAKTFVRFFWLTTYALSYFFGYERLRMKVLAKDYQIKNQHQKELILRSVIKPHFISNILSLIIHRVEVKSPAEAKHLRTFEKMISYNMSNLESNVSLRREIEQVNTIIEMYSLTLDKPPNLTLKIDIPDIVRDKELPPMLLANLVENQLTHGVLNDAAYPASLIINSVGNTLIFHSRNKKKKARKLGGQGIGMSYVKAVLESGYKGKHQLEIEDGEDFYGVYLTIEL